MPIIRSAIKKLRQDKKRTSVNKLVRSKVKKAVHAFKHAPSKAQLQKVYRMLDTAAKKNIYHKNKVNRLKSRLSRRLKNKPLPKAPTK